MNNKNKIITAVVMALLYSVTAVAEFKFIITRGYDQPTTVAVVPFCWNGQQAMPEDISSIVSADLSRTGQYQTLESMNMLSQPCRHDQVFFRDWQLLKQDYLVIGEINYDDLSQKYSITYRLYDVVKQANMHAAKVTGSRNQMRDLAHLVSDSVYEKLTGIRGVFSTRIAYVTVSPSAENPVYRVEVSDADGHRSFELFKSPNAIISLAWSADGSSVAFTNFDAQGRTRIKVANIKTRKVETLPAYPGINSGASFSPDGKRLAFVNSKSGNADIYTLNLETKEVRQLTTHWSIDTEPSWMPDGQGILFTSERGGRPQIYQMTLDKLQPQRLTFEGIFNAKAQYSSDGKHIVMVHQGQDREFHVAALEAETGKLRILTDTLLDESPSIAPNGTMLVYATKRNEQGVLAWATVDGELASIMPSASGHVREPAWSPYLR